MYLHNRFFCIVCGGSTDITERRLSTSCQRYCWVSKGLCVTCIFIACCCVIVLFSQGAHVTIKAHHEGDDVEEEKVVLEKVSKSSGARYGSTRKRPDQWNHPVQWYVCCTCTKWDGLWVVVVCNTF